MKPSKLVSIPVAAQTMGVDARWLRRLILRRERELGQRILVRVGEGQRRTSYRVSLSTLRRAEPALFNQRDEVAEAVRKSMVAFTSELSALGDQIESLEANVGALGEQARKGRLLGHRAPTMKNKF